MDIITREEIANYIKAYADANPGQNNTVKLAMGTGGTSWDTKYDAGLYALCDAMARSINEKAEAKREEMKNKLNTYWKDCIDGNFQRIKDALAGEYQIAIFKLEGHLLP